jgi:hypothetical protein
MAGCSKSEGRKVDYSIQEIGVRSILGRFGKKFMVMQKHQTLLRNIAIWDREHWVTFTYIQCRESYIV